MSFSNNKKTFLEKLDRSKKGSVDERARQIIATVNKKPQYYTTSSCSGRVYLWRGSGKKNETEWLTVSHDLIAQEFFRLQQIPSGKVWLRMEGFILHIACATLADANRLLELARKIFKKSALLSVSNKIIVEIRSSDLLEMPFYDDGTLLFSGNPSWLTGFINIKLHNNWKKIEKLQKKIKEEL